jgi:ABC-type multidrug transport system ATPase subunit
LKLLANQLHAGRVKGSVTFNGLVPDRDTHHSSVAFVQQADVHFGNVEVFPLPAMQLAREWCVDL